MKYEKLVAIGCDFTLGNSLDDPELVKFKEQEDYASLSEDYRDEHCFAGLVSKHYNLELTNLGLKDGSLDSIRETFIWYVDNYTKLDKVFFLIGLTHKNKSSWVNVHKKRNYLTPKWDIFQQSTKLYSDLQRLSKQEYEAWDKFYELYILLFGGEFVDDLRYKNTVYTVDGLSARNDLTVLQFHACGYPPATPIRPVPTLWDSTPMPEYLIKHEDVFIDQTKKPNEKAHRLIADRLIQYIDNVKILE